MESLSTRRVARISIVAAMYVVLTMLLASLAYEGVQFRVSEALMLLCLFGKDYVYALTIGCFLANIFSTVGPIDTVVGTAATLLAGICIYALRGKLNGFTASVFPILFNAVFVGVELKLVLKLPLFLSMAQVAFGEFVCVTLLGGFLLKALSGNKAFIKMISAEKSSDDPL